MKSLLHLNMVLAWLWIMLGFASGALLGLNFHRENWLGGYASHQRRLYRLGHISFFGLAMVNLLFAFTFQSAEPCGNASVLRVASRAFALGAVTMPLCCLLAAHRKSARAFFAVPVTSLLVGAVCALWEIIKL